MTVWFPPSPEVAELEAERFAHRITKARLVEMQGYYARQSQQLADALNALSVSRGEQPNAVSVARSPATHADERKHDGGW